MLMEWKSRARGKSKADPSLTRFLSSLKDQHNFLARAFVLKTEKKGQAIVCNSSRGTHFDDIDVYDSCNANADSSTSDLGDSDANDTGLSGRVFFTGSLKFTAKEI
jgi:hypothetical protein